MVVAAPPWPGSTLALGERMLRSQAVSWPVEPWGLPNTTQNPAEAHSWNSSNQRSPYWVVGPPWTLSSTGWRWSRSRSRGVTSQTSMSPPAGEGTVNRSVGCAGQRAWKASVWR